MQSKIFMFLYLSVRSMKRLAFIFLFAAMVIVSCGQNKKPQEKSFDGDYVTTPEDSVLATEVINSLKQEYLASGASMSELAILAGRRLLGNEYVAGTLDGSDTERLTLYLLKTDCILFAETCANLARAAVNPTYPDNAFYSFADAVRQTRYRNGVVKNYSDRIHYTTEWIRQAQSNGILEDKTKEFGGVVYDHPISFMSNNIGYYKQISKAAIDSVAAKDLAVIKSVEGKLNQTPQYYIKDVDIVKAEENIQTGDIIGFMSSTEGLDIAHVVLACVTDADGNFVYGPHGKDVKVGFMHASMASMKVIIDRQSIADYATSRKSITGICVARLN